MYAALWRIRLFEGQVGVLHECSSDRDRARTVDSTEHGCCAKLKGILAKIERILRPFLIAIIWATMVVVATWPLLLSMQRWLGGRRTLAIAVMTIAMMLVFVLPFWVAVSTLADYSNEVSSWTKSLQHARIPQPPAFIDNIPAVGAKISAAWRDAASEGWGALVAKLQPYVVETLKWLASEAGTAGMLIVLLPASHSFTAPVREET